jgi:PAS domain-containing protein
LHGKKILLEFDPSVPYERLIRDFALECVVHNEAVVVLTKKGSAVRQALEEEKGVEFVDVTPDLMLSPILEMHSEQPLSLIYDNLTDLALSTNSQTAYKFASSAMERLSDPRVTAIFLLNPAAHDSKDIYSLKGLFSDQIVYGKQGASTVRIA